MLNTYITFKVNTMEHSEYSEKAKDESREVIKGFANLVNNFNFEPELLINEFTKEHRTLQQNMFRTILKLICFMASDKYFTDGRNAGSKDMAKKLIAGYAEILKQQEKEHLLIAGYSDAEADAKAEEYKAQVIKSPEEYLNLSYV